ncbi:MAG: CinA family protein [Clostridia bacterium]|nr:CinA family protein [Clostridia bacterium]
MTDVEQLVSLLFEKKLKISAAESCTGGMFISKLIDIPGTSDIIGASYITYSDDAKINTVGVKAETIEKFGVVSENTALEMAVGAMNTAKSDIGVGITGFAGPSDDDNDPDAGKVCFGFALKGKTVSSTKHFGNIGRNAVRELSCIYAIDTLIKLIKTFGD